MTDSRVAATLSELDPSEYFAAWRYVSLLEQLGEIDPVGADAWRVGIYEKLHASGGRGAIADDADLLGG